MPQWLKELDCFSFFDDFLWFISPHNWTSVLTDSGTAAVSTTGVGGVITLTPSDGSVADNDEAYVGLTNAVFKPAANKPMYAEAYVQFAEANTNAANIAFGFASAVAANLIVDDGGGMRASGTVIAIYKVDGETVWRCVSRNGTAVTISQSTTTAGGTAYQKLSIELIDEISTSQTVVFRVDGALLRDATTGAPIRHQLDISSAPTAASLFAGVKNGSTTLETLLVDWTGAAQSR